MPNLDDSYSLAETRRPFFRGCGVGIGRLALGGLFARDLMGESPTAAKKPHFDPKATSIIYLFMAGGPSQLDMFAYKPKLVELNGQKPPDSFMKGKRFAFMERMANQKMLASPWKFAQCGK